MISPYVIPGMLDEGNIRQATKQSRPIYNPIVAEPVVKMVCDLLKIRWNDVRGKSRLREIVHARQLSMWVLYHHSTLTLKTIGILFCRDHSSVIHSCETVDNLRTTDKAYREDCDRITQKVVNDLFLTKTR